MADCLFARYQLQKHGWTEGAGLGKHEDGISKPIKVVRKNNKDGLGHIPGCDLTKNWWDQVYNKAASQISVETTKNGVAVHATERKESNKNKSLLYSRFVKGATLKASEGMTIEEPEVSNELYSEKEQIPPRLTDEEIFKICGGRTAHKAAGHGLKQNGKLQRIQEQERQYLESLNKRAETVGDFPISEPKRGKKHKRVAEGEGEPVILKEEMSSQEEEFHRKKRKKEPKEEAMQVEDSTEILEPTKKKKKKKCKEEREQNKKEEEEDKDQVIENEKIKSNKMKQKKKCGMQEELEAVDIELMIDSEKKRKKKDYLEEAAKESQEASDVEKVGIGEKKKQYEMQGYEETKEEFEELTNKKKKKHRVKKEQLEEVESIGKKKRKNQYKQEQELECSEENLSANLTLKQAEQEETGSGEKRKKKHKKKKKKKQETQKSFIENEEVSVAEQPQKVEEGLGGEIEGVQIKDTSEQESMKVDNCQKKVRFSSELVTVFTFGDEENKTKAQTPKKKKKRKRSNI